VADLVNKIQKQKDFCFDTETTSINPLATEIVGLAVSWEKGSGYLILFPGSREETIKRLNIIRPLFEDPGIGKTGQNLKFDLQVLANYGIRVRGALFDTMIAHYLLEPDMRHNMNLLSELYLSYSPVHIETLIGKKRGITKEYEECAAG
jgi:DNA polymerase-1